MATIAGVRFYPDKLVRYVDTCGIPVIAGDWVEVETDSGPKNGIVVFGPNQILHSSLDCSKMRLLGKVAKPFGQ